MSHSTELSFSLMAAPPLAETVESSDNSCNSATNVVFTAEDSRLLSKLLSGETVSISDEEFERINEAAVCSVIGDVILEYTESGYALIEDYREEVAELVCAAG